MLWKLEKYHDHYRMMAVEDYVVCGKMVIAGDVGGIVDEHSEISTGDDHIWIDHNSTITKSKIDCNGAELLICNAKIHNSKICGGTKWVRSIINTCDIFDSTVQLPTAQKEHAYAPVAIYDTTIDHNSYASLLCDQKITKSHISNSSSDISTLSNTVLTNSKVKQSYCNSVNLTNCIVKSSHIHNKLYKRRRKDYENVRVIDSEIHETSDKKSRVNLVRDVQFFNALVETNYLRKTSSKYLWVTLSNLSIPKVNLNNKFIRLSIPDGRDYILVKTKSSFDIYSRKGKRYLKLSLTDANVNALNMVFDKVSNYALGTY